MSCLGAHVQVERLSSPQPSTGNTTAMDLYGALLQSLAAMGIQGLLQQPHSLAPHSVTPRTVGVRMEGCDIDCGCLAENCM